MSRGSKKGRERVRRRPADRPRSQLRLLWGLIQLSALGEGAGRFGLLWGLLRVDRDSRGAWDLRLLWGLLLLHTPSAGLATRGAEDSQRPPDGLDSELVDSEPLDPRREATARAERRVDAVRKACILAGIGIGFGALGAWEVTGLFVAIGGGVLLASFAERLLGNTVESEVARAHLEIDARRSAAGEHARELQALSASIAHEIRNPITAAKSLVQQMGEDPRADDNIEYARVALNELERVERSVSHLLRFAREESTDALGLRLADVLEGALAVLAERAEKCGVEIRTGIDSEGLMVGDPDQLRRVILNLVGNAIDALAEAGSAAPCVTIELGDNLAGTEVWLRVRDNGPGIGIEDQGRIFNPFHTSKKAGTGLGLAITKKLVEAHGGTIDLKSSLGAGADFVLTFPREIPATD